MDVASSGIYMLYNIVDNKYYIGSAVNLRERWLGHRSFLNCNNHHSQHLQNAWNKYGEESFKFQVLEYVTDKNELLKREQYWIDRSKCYDSSIGYNLRIRAEINLGVKQSEEWIAKRTASMRGRKMTEKQRKALDRTGTTLTEKQKQARRDYRHTEEAKKKISARRLTEEQKQINRNYRHTEEAKAKIKLASLNQWKRQKGILNNIEDANYGR